MPQQPERYFVGPNLRDKLREVIARVDGMPAAAGGGGKIPVVHQEIPRPSTAYPVRLGKTSSAWSKGTLASIRLFDTGTPPSEVENVTNSELENCMNRFADVGADKWVMVAKASNGSWYLISAEC